MLNSLIKERRIQLNGYSEATLSCSTENTTTLPPERQSTFAKPRLAEHGVLFNAKFAVATARYGRSLPDRPNAASDTHATLPGISMR